MIRSPAGFDGDVRIKRYLDYYQPSYGVMMLAAGQAFSPIELFASGAPGVWYDPSDLTTMFQDAAGTTPVTAVEQPVGLRLDKSRNGVGTNGAKRLNLVSWSEDFSQAAWTKSSATATADTITATAAFGGVLQELTKSSANIQYKLTAELSAGTVSTGRLTIAGTSGFTSGVGCDFTLTGGGTPGTPAAYGSGWTAGTATIEAIGSGWYRCTLTATSSTSTVVGPVIGHASTAVNGNTIEARKIDFREAAEASTSPTPYQPITATWRDTIPGSHAFQTTDINRPVLSARYNFAPTSDFKSATWTGTGVNLSKDSTTTGPDGVSGSAQVFKAAAGNTFHFAYATSTVSISSGIDYIYSVRAKAGTSRYVHITFVSTSGNYTTAVFDIGDSTKTAATETKVGATSGTIASTAQQSLGDGWYAVSLTGKINGTSATIEVGIAGAATGNSFVANSGEATFNAAGTETVAFFGADLRVPNDGVGLPAYQRVTTATDYDTTGFPYYLRYNGTNSTMQTAAINFTSTDKMSVFAGVRKLSDAAVGMLAELSSQANANAGSFYIVAPGSGASYAFALRGGTNIAERTITTYTAPITNVLSVQYDIAATTFATEVVPQANAQTPGTITNVGSQALGGGSFGNYPLYIGARYNNPPTTPSAFYFNGRDYGLIVLGRTATATEIASTEAWLNERTRAYV